MKNIFLLASFTVFVFGGVKEQIKNDCLEEYGTNYRMAKYCVDKQMESYNKLLTYREDVITKDCKNKYGRNYRMVVYCIEKQNDARVQLGL